MFTKWSAILRKMMNAQTRKNLKESFVKKEGEFLNILKT